MSRIGNKSITIPENVTLSIEGSKIMVKGPKGELKHTIPGIIIAKLENKELQFARKNSLPQSRAIHGLTRALVNNMIKGVTDGFEKRLELVGTGFRVAKVGDTLTLNLGLSHQVEVPTPEGIQFELEANNKIIISGIDKQAVGQIAAEIRKFRPPEVYKGKGIRYEGEVVRRKAGKAAKVGVASGE